MEPCMYQRRGLDADDEKAYELLMKNVDKEMRTEK